MPAHMIKEYKAVKIHVRETVDEAIQLAIMDFEHLHDEDARPINASIFKIDMERNAFGGIAALNIIFEYSYS